MDQQKTLVAYATKSGSTADVAEAIGQELAKDGRLLDVRCLDEVADITGFTSVVIGAPMIMGWHRAARRFTRKNQAVLSKIPVAYFFTALNLTQTHETRIDGTPVLVDAARAKPPRNPARLSHTERYATPGNYLRPILKAAPGIKPVGVGFFGGKLDMHRLGVFPRLFVMAVIRAQAGDYRNWGLIRDWAAGLRDKLSISPV